MKLLLPVFLIFFVITDVFPQEINFMKQDWQAAIKAAKEKNKYIFMDAYTNWCSWCKVMDKQTFTDNAVAEFMNQNFIPLKMEMETGFGVTLAMKFKVTGYPTFLVFSPDGKLVYKIVGFQKPGPFLAALKKSIVKENQTDIKGLSTEIEPGFPDFYKSSFGKGTEKRFPDSTTVIKFLDSQKDLFSEVSWAVYTRFKSSDKFHDNFLANLAKYTELFGKEDTENQLHALIYRQLERGVKAADEKQLDVVLSMVDKYISRDKEIVKANYKISFWQGMSDWAKYTESVSGLISKSGEDLHEKINEYAWTVFENSDDPAAIKSAIKWMKTMTAKHPEYAYLDTYASLLFKGKDYEEAEKIASLAIETGKKNEEKTGDTEDLLNRIKKAKARTK